MRTYTLLLMAGYVFSSCQTPHSRPASNTLEHLTFNAGACFGTCPIFDMTIHQNGDAVFDAQIYNDVQGRHKTRISVPYMDTLRSLIAAGMPRTARDSFSVYATDHPSYDLAVYYTDGTSKTVHDYGPTGPEKLQRIYDYLFSLRGSQRWVKDTTFHDH